MNDSAPLSFVMMEWDVHGYTEVFLALDVPLWVCVVVCTVVVCVGPLLHVYMCIPETEFD